MGNQLDPRNTRRRAGNPTFAERFTETFLHELFLVFDRVPHFSHHKVAICAQPGRMSQQTFGPVALAAFRVDPELLVYGVVLLGRDSLELQDQFSGHDSPFPNVVMPNGTSESVAHSCRSCYRMVCAGRAVLD